jgi:Ca2+-binding EF-hand superfamily protein
MIDEMIYNIFEKYDTDRSGSLSRKETLRLLNDILKSEGKKSASYSLFDRFFNEFDENGDGVLSEEEMIEFVKKFMNIKPSEDDEIMDMVD